MSTTLASSAAAPVRLRSDLLTAWFAEVQRRQPLLASVAFVFVLALIPVLIAQQIDPRLVNGINVWIKPAKFLLSLAPYYLTLAWFFGLLSPEARRSRAARYVVAAPIAAGVLEMVWLIAAAMHGVPAHFNVGDPVWRTAYQLGGVGSLVLVSAMAVQGTLIARDRSAVAHPAYRRAVVLGSWLAAVATLLVAGYLSSRGGHWVGGPHTDADGLPIVGWARQGGDLRPAHFLALHLQQLLPLAGWLIARSGMARPLRAVHAVAALSLLAVAAVFVQALLGVPLLG
jgi:hypothetical protein